MVMIVDMAFRVEMVVLMGMAVAVLMLVGVRVRVGHTVVGVLVGVGMFVGMGVVAAHMIVMNMHNQCSFTFFLYYSGNMLECQNLFFIPRRGLRNMGKRVIMAKKEANAMGEHPHEHCHEHEHDHDHAYMHAHGIAHSHGHVHENQKAVVNRLARAIGHLEKVKRMVEEGYDCSEVLVQLAAVRSALDNTGKVILQDHLRHCMVDAVEAGDESAIDDLCSAIDKFMK